MVENMEELKVLVEQLKKETLQYKLFREFFPSIDEDDIFFYKLVIPTGLKDSIGDNIDTQPWVIFSDKVTEIIAVDNRMPIDLDLLDVE